MSRPNSPLQPNVSIEPSVSLTDGNQKEPSNVQKVDEGSDNDNCYSCDMCDTSLSKNKYVDSQAITVFINVRCVMSVSPKSL